MFTFIFNFKRFVANAFILLSFPLPPPSVPRKVNIQGFLDKTDNHWIDITYFKNSVST